MNKDRICGPYYRLVGPGASFTGAQLITNESLGFHYHIHLSGSGHYRVRIEIGGPRLYSWGFCRRSTPGQEAAILPRAIKAIEALRAYCRTTHPFIVPETDPRLIEMLEIAARNRRIV